MLLYFVRITNFLMILRNIYFFNVNAKRSSLYVWSKRKRKLDISVWHHIHGISYQLLLEKSLFYCLFHHLWIIWNHWFPARVRRPGKIKFLSRYLARRSQEITASTVYFTIYYLKSLSNTLGSSGQCNG